MENRESNRLGEDKKARGGKGGGGGGGEREKTDEGEG